MAANLEVDAIEFLAPAFSGVVGEILAIEQHPDADKLRVCQVAGNGDETVQVVCGALNARVGIKIPFAMVGAVLPGDFKIEKAKLRGLENKLYSAILKMGKEKVDGYSGNVTAFWSNGLKRVIKKNHPQCKYDYLNVLGANFGINAVFYRIRSIFNGMAIEKVINQARFLDQLDALPIALLKENRRMSFLRLAFLSFSCRRKNSEKIFFLFC